MAIIEFGTDELDVLYDAGASTPASGVTAEPSLTRPVAAPARSAAAIDVRRAPAGLNARMSGWWAAGLTITWIAVFAIGVALEPAPADPNAASPPVESAIVLGFLSMWVVMAIGFAKRRRYGAAASLAAAVFLVIGTISCPVSGHHSGIAAWWWFELAGSTALAGLSRRALRTV